jgi:hypothetical protein
MGSSTGLIIVQELVCYPWFKLNLFMVSLFALGSHRKPCLLG